MRVLRECVCSCARRDDSRMCVPGRVRECACSCAKRDGSRRVRECVCSCAKRDGSRMCVSGRVRECVCSCAKRDVSRVCVSAIDARGAHVAVAVVGCVSSCRVCGCRPSERAVRARARRAERRAAPDGAALPACRGLVACRVDARSMHVAASGGGQVPSCRTCGGRPSERVVRARARRAERRATPDGVALTACCGTCRSCLLLQPWRPCSRPSPRRTCGGRPSDRAMRARARRAEREKPLTAQLAVERVAAERVDHACCCSLGGRVLGRAHAARAAADRAIARCAREPAAPSARSL